MNPYKYYLYTVLCGVVLLVTAVGAFNFLIDPYAMLGTERIAGLNAQKPFAGDRGRVGKLHQALRVAPKGLVVGNSRPEMGLSPDHPCWPDVARPVYNIALPGLSIYKQVRYAQHAQAGGPAAALVMGVDFTDFLSEEFPSDPTLWPPAGVRTEREPFAVDPNGHPVDGFSKVRFSDIVGAVLSLDAFGHSLVTVVRQGDLVPTHTPAGFHVAEGIYQPIIRTEGPMALFAQKNRAMADRYGRAGLKIFPKEREWSPDFEAVRRLIRQGRAAGTKTVLVVNPVHAEYLLVLDAAGLWPEIDVWKRQLARMGRAEGVPVWDFSLFDSYSTEPVDALPPRGKGLQWFWEPSHYRRELGDLMLDNIWRDHCPHDQADAPRYGVRLDALSDTEIADFLADQRAARDSYKAAHPNVVARIGRLFAR
jgi:hypothetical protein